MRQGSAALVVAYEFLVLRERWRPPFRCLQWVASFLLSYSGPLQPVTFQSLSLELEASPNTPVGPVGKYYLNLPPGTPVGPVSKYCLNFLPSPLELPREICQLDFPLIGNLHPLGHVLTLLGYNKLRVYCFSPEVSLFRKSDRPTILWITFGSVYFLSSPLPPLFFLNWRLN